MKKPIARKQIVEFLGREPKEEENLEEEITVRVWLEEEGFDLIRKGEITQKDVAELFDINPSRVSHLYKKLEALKEEEKLDKYRRKLGKPLSKKNIKNRGRKGEIMSGNEEEEEVDELSGDEKELIELMTAMGSSLKTQNKVLTFYRMAPHVYSSNPNALYDLLTVSGVKANWARQIVDNFLFSRQARSPLFTGYPHQNSAMPPAPSLPMHPYSALPYGYYPQPHPANGGGREDNIFSSKFLDKVVFANFSKMFANMFSNPDRQAVPFVATEIEQRPVIGPDGKPLRDDDGNIMYRSRLNKGCLQDKGQYRRKQSCR